jgi:carbon storage regulator
MLVLSRAPGQSVVLDDRIVVTILGSRPGIVRIGIEAPDGVAVRRGELERVDPPGVGTEVPDRGAGAVGAGTRTSEA